MGGALGCARLGWHSWLGRFFATDFAGGNVFAQTFERCVTNYSIGRPVGKIDLGDECGFDPDRTSAGFGRRIVEGCSSLAEFV